MKIAHKLSLAFVVIGIVLTGTAETIFYNISKDSLRKSIDSKLAAVVVDRTNHIETYLDMLRVCVKELSTCPILHDFLEINGKEDSRQGEAFKQAIKRLILAQGADPMIVEFLLLDKTGKVVASNHESSIGEDESADPIFLGAWKEVFIKDVYYSEIFKEFLIGVSAPLLSSQTGELLGVLTAGVRLDELNNIVTEKTGMGDSGEIYIINNDGYMITPSRFKNDTFLKQKVDSENVRRLWSHRGKKHELSNREAIDVFPNYIGIQVLGTHEYIPQMQWTVLGEIDVREAFAPLAKLRLVFLAILFIVPFVAWLIGTGMAGAIVKSLRKLYKGTEIIGTGNLDYKVGTDARDEVGQLSRAFDAMTARLRQTTTSIDILNKEIIEREKVEKELQKKTLELDASLKEAIESREILTSTLEDNNAIREKIVQSEAMFRDIFDEAGEGILVADPQSKKFYMSNKAICRMLGYSKEEIENLKVLDIHPEKDVPYVLDQFERQAKGEFSLLKDVPVKRKDNSVFYADINATVIAISGKTYLMGLFHDISERREIEDLRRVNQLKKNFISNMSHELRTPLNAVIGFSEVLIDQKFGALNDTQKDYLNDILESGKFLLSLINDILDLSKIEAGKTELLMSGFSMKESLEHSLIFVKEKALKHNIELSLEIAEDVGYIRADERKVRQIIFNLLSNAVKFTPDGGKAGIKARINGSEVEVIVWDTGIGISKEDQNKLFKPFMQLEAASLAKKYEGTGLGLTLTKELVELHKGKIWVESEGRGKGAAFYFTISKNLKERKKIGEILIEDGKIREEDLKNALKKQEE